MGTRETSCHGGTSRVNGVSRCSGVRKSCTCGERKEPKRLTLVSKEPPRQPLVVPESVPGNHEVLEREQA